MLRGLLRKLGLTIPLGAHRVLPRVLELLADPHSPIPAALRTAFADICQEIRRLSLRVARSVTAGRRLR